MQRENESQVHGGWMDGWVEGGRGNRRAECATVKDGVLNSEEE